MLSSGLVALLCCITSEMNIKSIKLLSQIESHGSMKSQQFHNVKLNPADAVSRGLSAEELVSNEHEFKGTAFLWQKEVLASPA